MSQFVKKSSSSGKGKEKKRRSDHPRIEIEIFVGDHPQISTLQTLLLLPNQFLNACYRYDCYRVDITRRRNFFPEITSSLRPNDLNKKLQTPLLFSLYKLLLLLFFFSELAMANKKRREGGGGGD